jgi:hypothetical protein
MIETTAQLLAESRWRSQGHTAPWSAQSSQDRRDRSRQLLRARHPSRLPISQWRPGGSARRPMRQKEIKALYHRVEKDSDNFGRVFVHFHWK